MGTSYAAKEYSDKQSTIENEQEADQTVNWSILVRISLECFIPRFMECPVLVKMSAADLITFDTNPNVAMNRTSRNGKGAKKVAPKKLSYVLIGNFSPWPIPIPIKLYVAIASPLPDMHMPFHHVSTTGIPGKGGARMFIRPTTWKLPVPNWSTQ